MRGLAATIANSGCRVVAYTRWMDPSADRIIDLYERHARSWDGDRGRSLLERGWLDRVREVAGSGAAILDLGCGAGEPIAAYLIGCGHAITGVDSSPTLIGLCTERYPAHAWIVGDMRRVALGKPFGGILAWDSFCSRSFGPMPRVARR
jgi:SAM-dependent methyltransferase